MSFYSSYCSATVESRFAILAVFADARIATSGLRKILDLQLLTFWVTYDSNFQDVKQLCVSGDGQVTSCCLAIAFRKTEGCLEHHLHGNLGML